MNFTKLQEYMDNLERDFNIPGAASAYNFIDVESKLGLFYMQHVRRCNVAYDVIHPSIRDLVYECMEA